MKRYEVGFVHNTKAVIRLNCDSFEIKNDFVSFIQDGVIQSVVSTKEVLYIVEIEKEKE